MKTNENNFLWIILLWNIASFRWLISIIILMNVKQYLTFYIVHLQWENGKEILAKGRKLCTNLQEVCILCKHHAIAAATWQAKFKYWLFFLQKVDFCFCKCRQKISTFFIHFGFLSQLKTFAAHDDDDDDTSRL